MCLYPKLVNNPKYIANKKNRGEVPEAPDPRVLLVPVGCGKCIECLKKRAREWRVRLGEELKVRKGIYVTLTFSNESLVSLENKLRTEGNIYDGYEFENDMATRAVLMFSDRFKKRYKRRPRRWMVTELGGQYSERIHLHGIIFEDLNKEELEDLWKFGNVWIGDYCNGASVGYITKYLTKIDPVHKEYKPKVYVSPGMGKNFVENQKKFYKFEGEDTREFYRYNNGGKDALPIYYRNKLWTDEEREQLWLKKLDENKRYVMGTECKTHYEYEENRKEWRKYNDRWGFGNDEVNWERKIYENSRRRLLAIGRSKKVAEKLPVSPVGYNPILSD